MADDLTRNRITVQQALHGYSEGHRLISGSLKLPPQDVRAMLVLSDSSGSGVKIPADGYLTGYPLAGAGKYVLARTWSAPEMARPGCVWTHSLLVDFSDLARLVSGVELAEHLVRPSGASGTGYGLPIELTLSQTPDKVEAAELGRASEWIAGIYGRPRGKVIASRHGPDDDDTVLALWMQQWPRLRRAFRFCTLAVDDRSTSGDIFDLQLVDGSRSSQRARIPDAVLAAGLAVGDDVAHLVDDLVFPDRDGLRRFLRDVGGDITTGRSAMLPLTQLFGALQPGARPESISEAIDALEALGPGQGRLGRGQAVRLVFSRLDEVDDGAFDFALDQVRSDSLLMGVDPIIVGRALIGREPASFGDALTGTGPLKLAVDAVLPTLDTSQLTSALAEHPEALSAVARVRPDLLSNPAFWAISDIDGDTVLAEADLLPSATGAVVMAMMIACRSDCARSVLQRFGIAPVIQAIEGDDGHLDGDRLWPWLIALAEWPGKIAAGLADGSIRNRRTLILLSAVLDPDAVPNDYGEDPWVTGSHNSAATADDKGEEMLAAFLFCRAMGWRSRSAGRLMFLSVQRLHEALAANRLSSDAWKIVERRLPNVSPRSEWDRCERLRRAVVDRFVDWGLPPFEFGTVVDDGALWNRFVAQAADSYRGRRYLERVRKAMREGLEPWWWKRAGVIERELR